MADFGSFSDDLDQCQPSTSTSFASIDDDVNDDKDEDIHIVLLIHNADVEFKDIAVILAPPSAAFLYGCGCTLPGGGNVRCCLPTCCWLLSRLPSRHKRWHADLNSLVTALVVATDLGRPTTQTRPFPPTLNQ